MGAGAVLTPESCPPRARCGFRFRVDQTRSTTRGGKSRDRFILLFLRWRRTPAARTTIDTKLDSKEEANPRDAFLVRCASSRRSWEKLSRCSRRRPQKMCWRVVTTWRRPLVPPFLVLRRVRLGQSLVWRRELDREGEAQSYGLSFCLHLNQIPSLPGDGNALTWCRTCRR
ncbi:hypothetical protein BS78_05G182800 [Paspalum vaginatum]|nr:hypothetical protein BS78_05G182800 [Paspalum vaginatum]